MAEYPTTDLRSALIGAGLDTNTPSETYVDFATKLAKNQQEQAEMEQNLARAKELTAQSQIQTKQQQEAQAAGVNPLLTHMMTKEQAIQQVKLLLQEKGLDVDEDSFNKWAATLPDMVPADQIEIFANRFARETTRIGKDFTATAADAKSDKLDENEDHLIAGQKYAALYDNQGNVSSYIRSGEEPSTAAQTKLDLKTQADKNRAWERLGQQLTLAFKTRSGGLGAVSTSIFRAVRAINTINNYKDNLTAQDLENIAQDIGAIFQGGAPTVESAKGNNYQTAFTNFQNTFRKYTGWLIPTNQAVIKDTTDKMLQVLEDLRDSAINNLDKYAEFQSEVFKPLVEADPDHWDELKKKYIELASSGLILPPGEHTQLNITGAQNAVTSKAGKNAETLAPETGIPSLAEIQAERARRKAAQGTK